MTIRQLRRLSDSSSVILPEQPEMLLLALCTLLPTPSYSLQQYSVADGTSTSRTALDSLLFSVPTALVGLTLLLLGRALPRFFVSFAIAAAIALPTWSLSVNLNLLNPRTHPEAIQNILVWALVAGAFLLGVILSLVLGQHAYPFGLHLLSLEAGLAIAISVLIFSNQLTIHHPLFRWIFLALSPSISLLLTILSPPPMAISLACASSGAFLLFLAIDLLAKENDGMSSGIRFLLDHNPHHAQHLAYYHPPTLTRILLPLSWACMLLGALYQYKFLDKPFNTNWLPTLHRKPSASSVQPTVLIHHDTEKNQLTDKGISALSTSSHEDQSSSAGYLEHPPFPVSPQPHEFESPSQSEQRYTSDSYDTGLSAIPELTEHSTSGRAGSRSGSGSGRGISLTFPHSHRHPSNATSNSVRRSTRSSEFQVPTPPPHPISRPTDPSNPSLSPLRSVVSETTVFPDDSISQATRQRLGLTIYSHSGLIEEETEAMLTPVTNSPIEEDITQTDNQGVDGSNCDAFIEDSPTPGSTGLLTRLAHAFGEGSTSIDSPDLSPTARIHNCGEQATEEQALQSDARRWASLSEGQSPYEHTRRLRRDLHSWTSQELTSEFNPTS